MELKSYESAYEFNPSIFIDFDQSSCLSSAAVLSNPIGYTHVAFLATKQSSITFGVKFSSTVDCKTIGIFFTPKENSSCSRPSLKPCIISSHPDGNDMCKVDCGCIGSQCGIHVVVWNDLSQSAGTWELCEIWAI